MIKIGILASHRGSNLQAILDATLKDRLDAEVLVVISNNSRSPALVRAETAGIDAFHLSGKTEGTEENLDKRICKVLQDHGVELVLTLGYMKKLGSKTLGQFKNRIVNIHPSLLPKYGGQGMFGNKVHQAVLSAGDKKSGASIHLVDSEYDTGPVISQSSLDVLPDDTAERLAARILEIEHSLLIDTLAKIAQGEIVLP